MKSYSYDNLIKFQKNDIILTLNRRTSQRGNSICASLERRVSATTTGNLEWNPRYFSYKFQKIDVNYKKENDWSDIRTEIQTFSVLESSRDFMYYLPVSANNKDIQEHPSIQLYPAKILHDGNKCCGYINAR